ncbi:MAG: hypothetical protein M1820_010577 [Bogoriella megaspora]|nr:MAG: hypothetical protein M1820_010577 [Bogoriella megaspora]
MFTNSVCALSISSIALGIAGALITYVVGSLLYNIFFHPLRKFPGPRLAAASVLPCFWYLLKGSQVRWVHSLHEKYGPVVRVGPDELSYADGRAWKDINGHRTGGKASFHKDLRHYAPDSPLHPGVKNMIQNNDEDHARVRRIFSNAFSDQALKKQELLFLEYVDLFRDKIGEKGSAKFDLVWMLNCTTFDIMGDLTFGEPLGLLQGSKYIGWVKIIFKNIKSAAFTRIAVYYPILKPLVKWTMATDLQKTRSTHLKHSFDRVDRRLEKESAKPDIWALTEREDADGKPVLSVPEMHMNSNLFMLAGTETTATLLSGLNYFLLKNPAKMDILVREIRGNFTSDDDMSLERLVQLKYLNACLEEALRMYPPVPVGLGRIVPADGAMIGDQWVPGGATVSVAQYATYHSATNFRLPDTFIPERWFDPAFDTDFKAAMQAFSYGPRNCLGKNLAYHEMRLIEAKLLFNFDLHLEKESENWADQDTYILWEKHPLMVTASQAIKKAE